MKETKKDLFQKLLFRLELFHNPEEHKNQLVSEFIKANRLPFNSSESNNIDTYFDNYKKTIELLKSGNPCEICALIAEARREATEKITIDSSINEIKEILGLEQKEETRTWKFVCEKHSWHSVYIDCPDCHLPEPKQKESSDKELCYCAMSEKGHYHYGNVSKPKPEPK